MASQRTITMPILTDAAGVADVYIPAKKSGIEAVIILMDGLPLTFIKGRKTAYLRLSRVLKWHQDELPHTIDPKRKKHREAMVARLQEALRQFQETGSIHLEPAGI